MSDIKKKSLLHHKVILILTKNELKNSGNPIVVLPEVMFSKAIYFLFSDRLN